MLNIDELLKIMSSKISSAVFGHTNGEPYFFVSVEIEFYIIPLALKLKQTNATVTEEDLSKSLQIWEEIVQIGSKYGLTISELEQEDGLGQFEIQTEPTKNIQNLTNFISEVQKLEINSISFNSKPFDDEPGSAIHFHISMYDCNDISMFGSPTRSLRDYNPTLLHAIAGLLNTMPHCMYIFAPTKNCYKRFYLKHNNLFKHHPSTYSWGINNRTCAIRVPESITMSPSDTRIEHRVCSTLANPHEALLAILNGITNGIVKKLTAPQPIFGDSFNYIYEQERMPISLLEANYSAIPISTLINWLK